MQDDLRAFMPYPPHPVAHALGGLTCAVKDLFDVAGYPTDGEPLLTAQAEEIEAVRRLSHDLLLISVMTQRPQVTLPVAQTGGLPLGISFLGPRGSDRLLVELAAAFMQGDRNEQ